MQLYIWSCQHGILVQQALSLPGVLAWSDDRSEPYRQKARTATAEATDCRESFHMIIYIYIYGIYNYIYIYIDMEYVFIYIYIYRYGICIYMYIYMVCTYGVYL